MEQKERNLVTCKACTVLKERICIGLFSSGKNRRYVNDQGKLWNGKVCPDCHRNKSKNNMAKTREIQKYVQVTKTTA